MCFNQRGDISTLKGAPLKLVDKFTYLGRSVSSTENDIMRLAKVWTAIDRLSVIWKSDQTNKIKCSFFQTAVMLILLYGRTTCESSKLTTVVEGNLKAPFSIASTPRCRGGYSFPWIAPLSP